VEKGREGGREGGRIDQQCMCRLRLDLYVDVKIRERKLRCCFDSVLRESKKREEAADVGERVMSYKLF